MNNYSLSSKPLTSTSASILNHALTDKNTSNKLSLLKNNEQLERVLANHIANHPVAKHVMSTLANTLAEVFTNVHGEIKGWAEIIQAASRPSDSNRNGNGVLSARYDVIGCVGWNGAAIKSTLKAGSLREQGTLFLNLLLSPGFKQIARNCQQDEHLQQTLSHIIDKDYLQSRKENLYTMSGWSAQTDNSRKSIGGPRYVNAHPLLTQGALSQRELAFHKSNPVNHPSQQERIGYNLALKEENIQVLRGYGKDIWQIKPETKFAKAAQEHHKPTISGPSSSTSRFMIVAKTLAPACKRALGVEDTQAYLELVRFAAYAYFAQDDHHSMLEINLGAASHGLEEQWGDTLYTHPFSHPVQGKGFAIDNEKIQHLVSVSRS